MNKLEYYDRMKEPWDEVELDNLKEEYNIRGLTINEIGDIHRRTPGSISYRLKNLGLITHFTLSRGYLDYTNSDLYKEIMDANKVKDSEKQERKELRELKKLENEKRLVPSSLLISFGDLNDIRNEITSMKTGLASLRVEVTGLKADVKEILRLINAVYDFENQ